MICAPALVDPAVGAGKSVSKDKNKFPDEKMQQNKFSKMLDKAEWLTYNSLQHMFAFGLADSCHYTIKIKTKRGHTWEQKTQ